MTMPYAESEKHATIVRQAKVAQLRLAGVTSQTRIAEILLVNQSTISDDFKAIDAFWRERAQQDIAAAKGLDVERCERLIAACWGEAMKGHIPSVKMVIEVMGRRAKLLGLDAPVTVNFVQDEARRLAAEFGLNISEIMAEAQRIVTMPAPALALSPSSGIGAAMSEFE